MQHDVWVLSPCSAPSLALNDALYVSFILWLHFYIMAESGDASSMFIYVSSYLNSLQLLVEFLEVGRSAAFKS